MSQEITTNFFLDHGESKNLDFHKISETARNTVMGCLH